MAVGKNGILWVAGAALALAATTVGAQQIPQQQGSSGGNQEDTCFQLAQIAGEAAFIRANQNGVSQRQITVAILNDFLESTGKKPPEKFVQTLIGIVGVTYEQQWSPQQASEIINRMCMESELPTQGSGS